MNIFRESNPSVFLKSMNSRQTQGYDTEIDNTRKSNPHNTYYHRDLDNVVLPYRQTSLTQVFINNLVHHESFCTHG